MFSLRLNHRILYNLSILIMTISTVLPAFSDLKQTVHDFQPQNVIVGWDKYNSFGNPISIAANSKAGLIGIADLDNKTVFLMTVNGVLKKRIDESKGIRSPMGIAIGDNGTVYISDSSRGEILSFNSDGDKIWAVSPESNGEEKPLLGRIKLDRTGNLYVIDKANGHIYVFDKKADLKFKVGIKGDKRGEFNSLEDVAVDRQGRIYALDSFGTPIQVFDKNGKYLYKIGYKGSGDREIEHASGICIDANDQIWVADSGAHCLKVFDRNGDFLRSFGQYGTGYGELYKPIDIAIDSFGRVFVLEEGTKRVQVFVMRRPFERFTTDGL